MIFAMAACVVENKKFVFKVLFKPPLVVQSHRFEPTYLNHEDLAFYKLVVPD